MTKFANLQERVTALESELDDERRAHANTEASYRVMSAAHESARKQLGEAIYEIAELKRKAVP